VLIRDGKIEVITVIEVPLGTTLQFMPALGFNQFPSK